MGNKPLGAAFAHARASGKDQSHAARRRRANAWLRDHGHETMSRKVAKGILDRWRAMTSDERADEFNLRAAGVPPEVARALAMTGSGKPAKRVPRYGVKMTKDAPPKTVQDAARRGLDQMREFGGSGLTDGAKARARDLAAGKDVTPQAAKRIAAFLARHTAGKGGMTDDKGDPTPKAVAINLWGGKGAKAWAERLGAKLEKAEQGNLVRLAKRLRRRLAKVMAKIDKDGPTLGEQSSIGHAYGTMNPAPKKKPDVQKAGGWQEDKHPRADNGQFGSGSGSSKAPSRDRMHTAIPAGSHLASAKRHLDRAAEARKNGDHENARKHTDLAHEKLSLALGASSQRLTKSAVTGDLAIAKAAYAPQMRPLEEPKTLTPEMENFLNAQRLVAGMDAEFESGAENAETARKRASANLAANIGKYDYICRTDDTALHGVAGLNVDLACGPNRKRGFLGLDLRPFDYGTVIGDPNLPLPFPEGGVRALRVPSLSVFEDAADVFGPLQAIQSSLAIGGRLYLGDGARLEGAPWAQLPGLTALPAAPDGSVVVQRVAAKLPVIHGSDTDVLHVQERSPGDLSLAEAAFGFAQPAEMAMANLVQKSRVAVKAKVCKAIDWQRVVLGAVLVPDEVDAHNDIISAKQIEKTAHDFLAKARTVGRQHTDTWDGAEVVESYIAPVDMTFADAVYGEQTIPKGSWMLGVRIPEDSWDDVLSGAFTGFSVGGYGNRLAA